MAFKGALGCRMALKTRRQPRTKFDCIALTFLTRHTAQPPLSALPAGGVRRKGRSHVRLLVSWISSPPLNGRRAGGQTSLIQAGVHTASASDLWSALDARFQWTAGELNPD